MKRVILPLLVLIVVLVGLDRGGLYLSQREAAKRLAVKAPFATTPTVTVHGFPFLTQVVRGRYENIEVRGSGLQVGDIRGADLDAHLRGAALSVRDLVGNSVARLPCQRIDGTLTVPYSEIARLSAVPNLTLSRDGDDVMASASLTVPGLGSVVRVSGLAQLTAAGTSVHLSVQALSVAGVSLPSAIIRQLQGILTATIPLPALPYGLRVDAITPAADGLAVHGSARDVILTAPD